MTNEVERLKSKTDDRNEQVLFLLTEIDRDAKRMLHLVAALRKFLVSALPTGPGNDTPA